MISLLVQRHFFVRHYPPEVMGHFLVRELFLKVMNRNLSNSLFYTCAFNFFMNYFQNEWTDNVIGFHMPTYRACKTLWKTCVEYHTFYR